MSEKPLAPECYTNAQAWADDIAAIIDNLELRPLVLVGWSHGGLVICDYLRSFGQEHIAGIKFVAAAVTLNPAAFGTLIGPGFLHHVPGATADDLSANIEAIRAFVRGLAARPLSPEDSERVLCWNMVVPAEIRRALINRWIDSDDVLRALHKPVLLAHGRYDTVILPPMSEHILKTCPNSRSSWYEAAGHAPFLENAPRFNRELAQFVRETACVP
jgi:pimeloyl-ACP methyl ester carboxylesterase